MDKKNATSATGRRKCASARVRIDAGSGKIVVNGQKFEEYFETEALRGYVMHNQRTYERRIRICLIKNLL